MEYLIYIFSHLKTIFQKNSRKTYKNLHFFHDLPIFVTGKMYIFVYNSTGSMVALESNLILFFKNGVIKYTLWK